MDVPATAQADDAGQQVAYAHRAELGAVLRGRSRRAADVHRPGDNFAASLQWAGPPQYA